MKPRRNIETFSLSFLDCVCCGFGALILLLVLSKTAEPIIFEEYTENLVSVVSKLQEELFEIRGETHILNRELVSKKEQVAKEIEKVALLQGDLSSILGQYSASKDSSTIQNKIEQQLAAAKQELSEEMRRLQQQEPVSSSELDDTVGGIPVDSEYIIFIIDTSGSMFNHGWGSVVQKLSEVLDIYPKVKGIQVMNDMGEYMFTQYAGKWIPDTPARRNAIIKRLRKWQAFSNSSPVEGINAAINTFYSKNKKISLYVFGDEFTGPSIQSVLREVNRLNPKNKKGNRRVRIHAVGFPIQFSRPDSEQGTGVRFATLMRALCEENGGTFVGLNSHSR
ncbi:MAG: VWA domain-containing protein [Gammaproteobacteria bacterium]|nr:VWA domain-containing protein [Gammaproteobacteria bacterium]